MTAWQLAFSGGLNWQPLYFCHDGFPLLHGSFFQLLIEEVLLCYPINHPHSDSMSLTTAAAKYAV